MYLTNGMTREAARELGGWKSPAVMEAVHKRTRSGEVLPEMRAAGAKACAMLDVTACIENLERDLCPDSAEFLGPDGGTHARVWFHLFCSLKDFLAPAAVLPIRENFWSIMGRRARVSAYPTPKRG